MSMNGKKFDIENAINYMEKFVDSYRKSQDPFYKEFTMDTYLLDLLYGIGVSISEEYRMANGFYKFKKDLIEYLQETE